MELVKLNEQAVALDSEESRYIYELMEKQRDIEEELETIKASLLTAMEKYNIKKLENEWLTITYVAETYRETFNSKAFRSEHEDIYNDYVEIKPLKASVRLKLK